MPEYEPNPEPTHLTKIALALLLKYTILGAEIFAWAYAT